MWKANESPSGYQPSLPAAPPKKWSYWQFIKWEWWSHSYLGYTGRQINQIISQRFRSPSRDLLCSAPADSLLGIKIGPMSPPKPSRPRQLGPPFPSADFVGRVGRSRDSSFWSWPEFLCAMIFHIRAVLKRLSTHFQPSDPLLPQVSITSPFWIQLAQQVSLEPAFVFKFELLS